MAALRLARASVLGLAIGACGSTHDHTIEECFCEPPTEPADTPSFFPFSDASPPAEDASDAGDGDDGAADEAAPDADEGG
jgi:hypothetical protein